MRARILAASTQDPDRLAKVEPTDRDLARCFDQAYRDAAHTPPPDCMTSDCVSAARRALYNLGREHGGRSVSAIATESIAMATKWRMAEAENAALLARAEKAERQAANQVSRVEKTYQAIAAWNDSRNAAGQCDDLHHDVAALVADWQKRGEELEAARKELCAARSSLVHALDCVSEARMQLDRDEVSKAMDALDAVENGVAKAALDLATVAATPTPEPINKVAELRAAGWNQIPGTLTWAPSWGKIVEGLDDAHAAMLAERARATPRDTLTDPRPGDLFVDKDGDTWLCTTSNAPISVATADGIKGLPGYLRPARPEEVAKFRKDHGLGPRTLP
jgi:hypothetical protein